MADTQGADLIIGGGGGPAYGEPIEFVAQTLRDLDPLVQDYQSAMRMSDAANGLIAVSNTACATGIGGYSQSQIPTTLTAQDLATTGAPTQSPATALEAPSPSPTTMDPPGEQEPAPEPQLENGNTAPSATTDASTAADTSSQDAAAGGVIVIVWTFGSDANKEPADLEDRSTEKNTDELQLKLAGPEQGAQQAYSLLVGPPQNADEAAAQAANTATQADTGGQETSGNNSTQDGQSADDSSADSIVIIVMAPPPSPPPLRYGPDPNSPFALPVSPGVAADRWLINLGLAGQPTRPSDRIYALPPPEPVRGEPGPDAEPIDWFDQRMRAGNEWHDWTNWARGLIFGAPVIGVKLAGAAIKQAARHPIDTAVDAVEGAAYAATHPGEVGAAILIDYVTSPSLEAAGEKVGLVFYSAALGEVAGAAGGIIIRLGARGVGEALELAGDAAAAQRAGIFLVRVYRCDGLGRI